LKSQYQTKIFHLYLIYSYPNRRNLLKGGNRNMKKLLGSMLMASAMSFAYAEGEAAPEKGQMLEEAKAHATKMIDMRIKALQESKTCISKASSREDMQKCREATQKEMKEIQGAREEKRKEMKGKREEWKAKREEWKAKRKENRGGPKPDAAGTDAPPPAEGEE
jgi:hypothetical protein